MFGCEIVESMQFYDYVVGKGYEMFGYEVGEYFFLFGRDKIYQRVDEFCCLLVIFYVLCFVLC